jgi:serine protease Do
VDITVTRKGSEQIISVILKNKEGNLNMYKRNDEVMNVLGAELEDFTNSYGNIQGVRVAKLSSGKLKAAGVKEGFLVTKVNGKSIKDKSDMQEILSLSDASVYIEGIYPNGQKAYYAFGI